MLAFWHFRLAQARFPGACRYSRPCSGTLTRQHAPALRTYVPTYWYVLVHNKGTSHLNHERLINYLITTIVINQQRHIKTTLCIRPNKAYSHRHCTYIQQPHTTSNNLTIHCASPNSKFSVLFIPPTFSGHLHLVSGWRNMPPLPLPAQPRERSCRARPFFANKACPMSLGRAWVVKLARHLLSTTTRNPRTACTAKAVTTVSAFQLR